jgi:CRP/FNR family transcriptional regulator, cyclic AMP receptor protein
MERGCLETVRSRQAALCVLDADPDLGQDVPAAEYEAARHRAVAGALELGRPAWNPSQVPGPPGSGWLGLFVADGILLRRVTVASRVACELFGRGDVLRPWDEQEPYEPLRVTVDWLVLEPALLAVLDDVFAQRVARWPCIAAQIMERIAGRARDLALAAAVTHLPRADERMLLLFWLLAQRWGAMTREGVLIKVPLTHELLATLIGSRRPTVTIAVQKLARDQLLIRHDKDRWLITAKAIQALGHTRPPWTAPPAGRSAPADRLPAR